MKKKELTEAEISCANIERMFAEIDAMIADDKAKELEANKKRKRKKK